MALTASHGFDSKYYRFNGTIINLSECYIISRFGAQLHFFEKRGPPRYEPDVAGGFTIGKRALDRSITSHIQYISVAVAITEFTRIETMLNRSRTIGNTIYNLPRIRSIRLSGQEIMFDFDGKIYVERFANNGAASSEMDAIWTEISALV